jgi:hypothetical protein
MATFKSPPSSKLYEALTKQKKTLDVQVKYRSDQELCIDDCNNKHSIGYQLFRRVQSYESE